MTDPLIIFNLEYGYVPQLDDITKELKNGSLEIKQAYSYDGSNPTDLDGQKIRCYEAAFIGPIPYAHPFKQLDATNLLTGENLSVLRWDFQDEVFPLFFTKLSTKGANISHLLAYEQIFPMPNEKGLVVMAQGEIYNPKQKTAVEFTSPYVQGHFDNVEGFVRIFRDMNKL